MTVSPGRGLWESACPRLLEPARLTRVELVVSTLSVVDNANLGRQCRPRLLGLCERPASFA